MMSSAAHALSGARNRRRSLDLNHQIDRAHVDAQFEGGRGHHRAQTALLQRRLDQLSFFLGQRTVMSAADGLALARKLVEGGGHALGHAA